MINLNFQIMPFSTNEKPKCRYTFSRNCRHHANVFPLLYVSSFHATVTRTTCERSLGTCKQSTALYLPTTPF